ncbi:MAG: recombinase RecJ, partial [Hadesarchaea archaeon CG08_land_8_20_14_0_20_51_8]
MFAAAKEIASLIQKQERVKVISHIDADGISSAGIIAKMLERAGIKYDVEFVKQLDPCIIEKIGSSGSGG